MKEEYVVPFGGTRSQTGVWVTWGRRISESSKRVSGVKQGFRVTKPQEAVFI